MFLQKSTKKLKKRFAKSLKRLNKNFAANLLAGKNKNFQNGKGWYYKQNGWEDLDINEALFKSNSKEEEELFKKKMEAKWAAKYGRDETMAAAHGKINKDPRHHRAWLEGKYSSAAESAKALEAAPQELEENRRPLPMPYDKEKAELAMVSAAKNSGQHPAWQYEHIRRQQRALARKIHPGVKNFHTINGVQVVPHKHIDTSIGPSDNNNVQSKYAHVNHFERVLDADKMAKIQKHVVEPSEAGGTQSSQEAIEQSHHHSLK